jgi:hypothetical protein
MRILILSVLLIATPISWGQSHVANPRLSKSRPSVYITFDHLGRIAPISSSETEDIVWLRLHNNTRWPIIFVIDRLVTKKYGAAALYWDVGCEGNDSLFFTQRCGDSIRCTFKPLPPGHDMLFTVRHADLGKGCFIRVKFSYSWEDKSGEPEHLVYFYSSALPIELTDGTIMRDTYDTLVNPDFELALDIRSDECLVIVSVDYGRQQIPWHEVANIAITGNGFVW